MDLRLGLDNEQEDLERFSYNSPYKESLVSLNNEIHSCGSEAESAHESSGSYLGYAALLSQDRSGETAVDKTCDVSMLEYNMTSSPITHRGSDNDPVTAAAYMHLLGESLSLIGHCLQETDKLVCVSKSLCVLLDSLLCTLAPLISLTSQIPELQGCFEHTVDSTLENVSYVMPGL